MAGLLRPRQGRVSVDGEVWVDTATGQWLAPQQRHVGLVFQHYALMPHLDACDNVALSLLHLPKAQRQAQARRWLDHVGLDAAQQQRRPAALSGGQQQRVAMARALARQPRLLLLDEPFAAVDQMTRQGLYRLLADLRRELAIPIVLVTHDLHEARLLADRLVVLDQGRVLQQGTPAAIHRAPRNARVADLVGLQNRFEGVWLGPAEQAGVGRLRWMGPRADMVPRTGGPADPSNAPQQEPVLLVPDKGRLQPGQAVSWVIPGEAIELIDPSLRLAGDLDAVVSQVRHLGEITLTTVHLTQAPHARLTLTLAGAGAAPMGALPSSVPTDTPRPVAVRLDTRLVHVMPVRSG
jgi:molybdate transport system ATP-binding protein